MVGDMDNTGSLNAQIIHQLTTHVRTKLALQVRNTHWTEALANSLLFMQGILLAQ